MAGHSHWARIKRAKAVTDSRRGRHWSKLSRAIIVAARSGGGDPDANLSLRYAMDAAREANMPKDTIERAVKKGTGELGQTSFEELVYEGYGPGGVAILATGFTDNRHRTAPEIKKIFELNGGNLGSSGSVGWMFTKRGAFIIPAAATTEDALTEIALGCGADDVQLIGDAFEVACDPTVFDAVKKALIAAGVKPESSEITMAPSNTITVEGDAARQNMELMEQLDAHDDIQKVYSNFELSDADAARME